MEKSYDECINEIEDIVSRLESGETAVDQIADMVKQAAVLLKNCQDKLRGINADIEGALEG